MPMVYRTEVEVRRDIQSILINKIVKYDEYHIRVFECVKLIPSFPRQNVDSVLSRTSTILTRHLQFGKQRLYNNLSARLSRDS